MAMAGVSPATQSSRQKLNHHLICPECKQFPPDLVEDGATTVCESCGLVLTDRIVSLESEWRTFSNDEGKTNESRIGEASNALLNRSQLETTIAIKAYGNKYVRDIQRAHGSISDVKKDNNLISSYRRIDSDCEGFGIPRTVRETAKDYFKQVEDAKALKGKRKPQDVIIASCIFLACRQCRLPRTFQEIFQLTNVPKKEINKTFRWLENFLSTNSAKKAAEIEAEGGIINQTQDYEKSTSARPQDLCPRFCNMLGLGFPILKVAEELANRTSMVTNLEGCSPLSTASACIYMAANLMGETKSTKDISTISKVSDSTIRTAYGFLYAEREKLVDQSWLGERNGDMSRLPIV